MERTKSGGSNASTDSKGKGGFWRRMTASSTKTPQADHRSFRDFEVEQDDAWGDEINQFQGLSYHRKSSVGVGSTASSRQGSRESIVRPPSITSTASNQSSRSGSPTKPAPNKVARSKSENKIAAPPPAKDNKEKRTSRVLSRPPGHQRSMSESSVIVNPQKQASSRSAAASPTASPPPEPDLDRLRREATAEAARVAKFKALLDQPRLDLDALRELSWSGIPASMRPDTWRLLSGYLPANIDRREITLERKRSEYRDFVEQYYGTRDDEGESSKTFHQIQIDVLRTNPTMPSFHNDINRNLFERILYIWALRHPASGYVQGINELVTPFVSVFLSQYHAGAVGQCDASVVTEEQRDMVEADAYWCLTKLLDGIQDHYTAGQPGIQKKIAALKDLAARVDATLHEHLGSNGLDYLTFTFRWMNCMLMREIPLPCSIRLWDTYHAEADGFASFHLYTCLAFLTTFKKEIKAALEFQDLIMLLQKPPTQKWTEKEIAMLLAEAYSFKFMFHDAKKHLTQSI